MNTKIKRDNKSDKEKGRTVLFPPNTDNSVLENKIITDPFGSWTGVSVDNELDKPVQDVDDL